MLRWTFQLESRPHGADLSGQNRNIVLLAEILLPDRSSSETQPSHVPWQPRRSQPTRVMQRNGIITAIEDVQRRRTVTPSLWIQRDDRKNKLHADNAGHIRLLRPLRLRNRIWSSQIKQNITWEVANGCNQKTKSSQNLCHLGERYSWSVFLYIYTMRGRLQRKILNASLFQI